MKALLVSVVLIGLPIGVACAQNGWGTGGGKHSVAPGLKIGLVNLTSQSAALVSQPSTTKHK